MASPAPSTARTPRVTLPPPPPGPRPQTARPPPARLREPFGRLSAEESQQAAANFLVVVGFGEYVQSCADAKIDLNALSQMSVQDLQLELGVKNSKEANALKEECWKLHRMLHRSSNAIELPSWVPNLLIKPRQPREPAGRPMTAPIRPSEPTPPDGAASAPGGRRKPGQRAARRDAVAARREPTMAELRMMESGVQPPPPAQQQRREAALRQLVVRRVPNAEGAAAAEAAKRRVMAAITAREEVLGQISRLVPAPRSHAARQKASHALYASAAAVAARRRRLVELVGMLRARSVVVVAEVARWKAVLNANYAYFAAVPDAQMAFFLPDGGGNYLLKMCVDVGELLPVPATQDPLLLHWFGEQLPWLLRDVEELPRDLAELGHVHPLTTLPVDREAIAAFVPPPDTGTAAAGTAAAIATAAGTGPSGPPTPSHAQLAEAQAALLAEGTRGGVLHAPDALLPIARRRERMERDPGKTWRRAALQMLLYGGEHYRALLAGFPSWFRHGELSKAATQVQRHFRERKLRKLMRTLRSGKESAQTNPNPNPNPNPPRRTNPLPLTPNP